MYPTLYLPTQLFAEYIQLELPAASKMRGFAGHAGEASHWLTPQLHTNGTVDGHSIH